MSYLYNRDFLIQAGTKLLAARQDDNPDKTKPMLRASFRVELTPEKDPNTALLMIYNLSSDSRKSLQKKQPLIIEAGYTGTRQQIFSGEINYIQHQRETVDWVTYLETGDGSEALATQRISKSFGPNTSVYDFLKAVAAAMGVGLGNTVTRFNPYTTMRDGFRSFKHGVVLHGKASQAFDKAMRSAGLQWSIQNGELQVLEPGETTLEEVVILNSKTGMLGSPEVGEKGKVVVRSLMQGSIKPGRRLVLESNEVKGQFKILNVSHVGDTYMNDWYTEAEAKPV